MRLGIDIDGVLADWNHAFITLLVKTSGRDLFPPRPFPITMWHYPALYQYTPREITTAWSNIHHSGNFWESLPGYPETRHVATALQARETLRRDDLYFITARPGLHAKVQTESWLMKQGIFKPTVLLSERKGHCALALDLDAYIDDRLENIRDVVWASPGTRAFLLTRDWNVHYPTPVGATRVASVVEFLEASEALRASLPRVATSGIVMPPLPAKA